jgi:hypothetical protein
VFKGASIGISGTPQQIAAAVAALDACAKAKGVKKADGSGDGAGYIAQQPMKDQLSTARACVAGTGATLDISYVKSEAEDGNGCTSPTCYYEAVDPISSSGGSIHYQASPLHNFVQVQIPPGSLSLLTPIFLTPTLIDTPLPPGSQLATYPFSLSIYGTSGPQLFFNNPVFLQISYPMQDTATGLFEVLPNGQLMPIPAQISNGLIQAQVMHGGTFVALEPGGPLGSTFCFGDGSTPFACPCNNTGMSGHGCNNSIGTGGAELSATGTTNPDTVVLTSSHELANALSIFLQGTSPLPAAVPFGDGLRCVGGTLKRLYVKNAVNGVVSAPGPSDPSITTQSANLGDPIPPGSARIYFVYYRDPNLAFCPPPQGNSWNDSPAGTIQW